MVKDGTGESWGRLLERDRLPPWEGGTPTLWGTRELGTAPNAGVLGCCGSREASGWKRLMGPPWTGLFSSVWSLLLPGLVLKLIKCCRAL